MISLNALKPEALASVWSLLAGSPFRALAAYLLIGGKVAVSDLAVCLMNGAVFDSGSFG